MGTVIAIDGPAGSGKSTLARRLAAELDLPYLNTGLMYRAVAFKAWRDRLDLDDEGAITAAAQATRFDLDPSLDPPGLLIDGEPPVDALTSPEVESSVSRVSRHPRMRAVLRDEQRRLARGGAVMEGRDIGAVVAPDATLKVFLDARPDERVTRRSLERGEEGPDEGVGRALDARDEQDARTNPLEPAPDALVIDTTDLDADAVFERALAAVRERTGGRG